MTKEQSDAQKILELVLRPTLSFYPAHASYNEIHFTEFEAQLVVSFPSTMHNRDQSSAKSIVHANSTCLL